ncbi:MAG: homoserine dehydrogenase [Cycloclasticus sp. symbiont of Poecilosclerida sp. M]|nr:MAG: homoserine dehydrogenase [Cycloclasticus sp. symbiont of Poecilosclerida sp. M]
MKVVKVGILGLGTVGGGTVNVLQKNQQDIGRRTGCKIIVTRASARDVTRPRICSTDGIQLTTNPKEIINDPEIQIILELMGGEEPAKSLIIQSLKQGKHVVTANKALIANHGNELFEIAAENNVVLAYEAAIAGGIPIVKAMREGLSGNSIEWLSGIINGTGNFILTEMRDKGSAFADVLKEAQELGYAEADPEYDVEGIDAAHKLCILASLAFGIPLNFKKVYTEGISKITPLDVTYAEELGYRIKHLGVAKKTDVGVEMRVHLTLIPENRLIANVDGVMNAVLVKGNAVGPTLYYGPGAGADATGSAVVADIVDLCRQIDSPAEQRVPPLGFASNELKELPILLIEEVTTAFYLRLSVEDKPGVMAAITTILADNGISIEAVLQKELKQHGANTHVILLTDSVVEKSLLSALSEIESLSSINEPAIRIRVESLQ